MGHIDQLMSTLLKFRENEILCDTILGMKDREIKAHSVMLAAVIPVFQTAFECHGSSGTYQVDLPNIEAKVMEVAIHFIYTGTLLLPVDYKDIQKLNQLFLSLQELGLDTDRFNGCEMLFERFVVTEFTYKFELLITLERKPDFSETIRGIV